MAAVRWQSGNGTVPANAGSNSKFQSLLVMESAQRLEPSRYAGLSVNDVTTNVSILVVMEVGSCGPLGQLSLPMRRLDTLVKFQSLLSWIRLLNLSAADRRFDVESLQGCSTGFNPCWSWKSAQRLGRLALSDDGHRGSTEVQSLLSWKRLVGQRLGDRASMPRLVLGFNLHSVMDP